MSQEIKVVYIAGQGRSGSTILGNILGQIGEFVHVGELLEIWSVIKSANVPCGCGVPVIDCDRWRAVLDLAFGLRANSIISEMLEFRLRKIPDRYAWQLLTPRDKRNLKRRFCGPLDHLSRLYRAIQEVFECRVIIDSSKHSMYAHLLQLAEGVNPYIVHLTRDPRATAFSFLNKRVKDGQLLWMRDLTPLQASMLWDYKHLLIHALGNRLLHAPLHLRYEDFIANPANSLDDILKFVGESQSTLPLLDAHCINIETQHTVSGNPSRFQKGMVHLVDDEMWRTKMPGRHKLIVTFVTAPLMLKYGYPIFGRGPKAVHQGQAKEIAKTEARTC